MASKALLKDRDMLQPTVVNDSFLVPLEDISTAADSGWRQLDSTRLIA